MPHKQYKGQMALLRRAEVKPVVVPKQKGSLYRFLFGPAQPR